MKSVVLVVALASLLNGVTWAEAKVRRLVCLELYATDGDSITCDGTNMRDMGDGAPDVSGYDTPEIRGYKCVQELALGQAATARMELLLATKGIQVIDSGVVDRF